MHRADKSTISRSRTCAFVVVLALAGGVLVEGAGPGFASQPASPVAAAPTCPTGQIEQKTPGEYQDSNQDFDDTGMPDLAVGVPSAAVGGVKAAGALDVHYDVQSFASVAVTPRAPQRVSEASLPGKSPQAGERFGASSAVVDIDGNGCEDLAIGAPGRNGGTGVVVILHGSPTGLSVASSVRLVGKSAGESFGASVVGNGHDIWVGAPNRAVDGQAGAGAVDHYRVTGDTATLVQTITQSTAGIGGTPEVGDHFGSALAVDSRDVLAIGIPDESIGALKSAGMVTVAYPSGADDVVGKSVTIAQSSPTLSGTPEAGDRFGASVSIDSDDNPGFAYLAVGVPGESIGSKSAAGVVQVVQVTSSGKATQRAAISQDSPTIEGTSEAQDRFGARVQLGGIQSQFLGLLISSPGESLGSVVGAGTVDNLTLRFAENGALTVRQEGRSYFRGAPGVADLGGTARAGDEVGAQLSLVASPSFTNDPFVLQGGGAAIVTSGPGVDVGATTDAGTVFTNGVQGRVGKPSERNFTDSGGAVAGEQYGVPASVVPSETYFGD